ncbi:NAD(P)-binding protein [Aspergillus sclerotioniger CBS 115572]|uniref:NAD(P)-binding protein n=1 Tax=Aspergillus sclerotioniger CBS 115572 TaxID=1450535 RepID=A0A317W538_9EURO|nr:NAD(P)-binding protein [Aspergillus sclerotioniger CBS 115572]PWY81674.1 NAD(P)-binding protein [Aspergillus sclerotioniger CBS 115572]
MVSTSPFFPSLTSPKQTPTTIPTSHSEIRASLAWATYNPILGHEGIGTVIQTPRNNPSLSEWLHVRVGIKWLHNACTTCSVCTRGSPHYCPHQVNTSRHVPGTLQQYVLADARFLTRIPVGLADELAAPLLCAGLTMMGALGRLDGLISPGEWVVISGSGGGLGHIGCQIASRVKGWRVIAIDHGEEKRRLSLEAGAEVFVDFRDEEDVGARALKTAQDVIRHMGVMVCVALPENGVELPVSATGCAARGITIVGSSVGTEEEMVRLLELAVLGVVRPEVRVYGFEETEKVIRGLERDGITGRAVVRIPG